MSTILQEYGYSAKRTWSVEPDPLSQKSLGFWYNPVTKWVSVGERMDNNGRLIPTYERPVRDMRIYGNMIKRARNAGLTNFSKDELDEMKYGGWSNEWLKLVTEFYDATEAEGGRLDKAEERVRKAGIIKASDFGAMNYTGMIIPNVMGQVLNTTTRPHFLMQAVTTVPVPNLTVSIDTWSGFGISEDLDEFDYAQAQKGSLSRQTFTLKKNIGHVAFSEEQDMNNYYHNIEQLHTNYISLENEISKNQKIDTELETATAHASTGDWGAMNGTNPTVSNVNPLDNLGNEGDTLYDNLANIDRIVTGTRARRDYYTNTYLRGIVSPVQAGGGVITFGSGVDTTTSDVTGVKWIYDRLVTATIAIILDSSAVWFLDGPKRQAMYEDGKIGFRGIVSKDWHAVKTVQSSKIVKLTGVSA